MYDSYDYLISLFIHLQMELHSSAQKQRIVPARELTQRCKEHEEIPVWILQVPFVKISVEDCAQNLPERFFGEAALQDPK